MVLNQDIDPNGDLILIVGPDQIRFKVARAVCRLACPSWNAMFSGRFVEGYATEVELPADDAEALLLLLNILYYRTSSIPVLGPLSLQLIARVAQLADKYDLVNHVQSRIDDWLRVAALWPTDNVQAIRHGWAMSDPAGAESNFYLSWLWISWALKRF
jgi:hypothetical protein